MQTLRNAEINGTNKLTNCRKNNIGYSGECSTCKECGKSFKYEGESARNLYIRSKEHYRCLNSKSDKSWMWKHVQKEHEGKKNGIEFDFKITGKFRKPLRRQLDEAYRIEKNKGKGQLNSKKEHNGQRIKRVTIENNDENQCNKGKNRTEFEESMTKHKDTEHEYVKPITCNQCRNKITDKCHIEILDLQ